MKIGRALLAVVTMLAGSCQERGTPGPAKAIATPDGESYALEPVVGAAAFVATHPTMRLRTELDARGATLSRAGEPWHVTIRGARVECGGGWESMDGEAGPTRGSLANRVSYARSVDGVGIDEWFVHGPTGVEHGFALEGDPCAGTSGLTIEVHVDGLAASLDGSGTGVALRDASGATRLHYTNLSAHDADGRALGVAMTAQAATIGLEVDTFGARFPVVVDPLGWTETQELLAGDGGAGDRFGNSIAISGTVAVIGASSRTVGQNAYQGAAYVFAESDGSWSQQAELLSNDGAEDDRFGSSVAIDGGTLIVGALANGLAGAAYVFTQTGGTWTQTAKIVPSDGAVGDNFGSSVALSEGTLVIGTNSKNGQQQQQGAAYVFVQSGSTWSQQAELVASDAAAFDDFGSSVAISGSTAVIGAAGNGPNETGAPGTAYVFIQSGSSWSQQAELVANNAVANDYFGDAVAIAGTTALVGAMQETVTGNVGQGAAYVFVQSGGTWTQVEELVASDGASGAGFGASVAISASTLLVGAPGAGVSEGAAYVYAPAGSSWWTQQAELSASNGVPSDNLGESVALAGSTAMFGAPSKSVGSNQSQGAAYVDVYGYPNGGACTTASSCVSGNCVDGFCCDKPCTGLCQACAAALQQPGGGGDGTCSPVAAGTNPHHDDCPVTVASTCGTDGECDGAGNCQDYVVGTPCGTVCAGNSTTPEECNGTGVCGPGGNNPTSCGAYKCMGEACLTECTSDSDCEMGQCNTTTRQCTNGATCTADGTGVIPPGGSESNATSCAPYVCQGSQCKTSCATVSDCTAPNVCTASGVCAAPPSDGGSSGGCALRTSRENASTDATGGIALVLVILGGLRARRRRG